VRRELRHWQAHARRIPDPHLRRIAVETARRERGNYEGAAAFAAFVPRRMRARVVRAAVAYQLAYDYADSLAEEAAADRVANGRALHEALVVAVSPARPHPPYYAHATSAEDGGYLSALVDACRKAVEALPSWGIVDAEARATSRLVIEFQALHHGDEALLERELSAFASAVPQLGGSLRWWEAAAGGASSLGVFALVAAAARPRLTRRDAESIQRAYVPWIGALHVLLDSLVDAHHDAGSGQHSLVGRYASRAELAASIETIALEALRASMRCSSSRWRASTSQCRRQGFRTPCSRPGD